MTAIIQASGTGSKNAVPPHPTLGGVDPSMPDDNTL